MVSLADIFNNAKIKVQNNELYNKLLGQEYNQVPLVKELPLIKPVQMREDGSMYEIEQPIEKKPTLMQRAVNVGNNAQDAINNIGSKLGNYLLGEQDITSTQGEPIKDKNGNLIPSNTISATPRRGGVLRDIAEGYRENRNTPFSIDNLGGRKTFANRFGEGLGSLARFAESPLGRSLLMAGIVGATGGGALPALAFGTTTGVLNQQNRMKDQLYRNELITRGQNTVRNQEGFNELTPEEQNAQLQKIADSVNAYRGYLGDDTYRQILTGLQLQDNAEYRNAMLAFQQRNQELANRMAQERFDYTKQQDAKKNEREDRKLNIAEGKIKRGTQKFRTAIGDKKGALEQIRLMRELVKNNPDATGYIIGKFAKGQEAGQKIANEFLSSNPESIKTRAAISKLRGTTMHDLAGTAQTLQEQRNLAPFLPDNTDNAKTILAKLDQLEAELKREMSGLINTGYELGYDVEDFENYTPQAQTQAQTTTNVDAIVNKLKQNGYSDAEISEYLRMKGY